MKNNMRIKEKDKINKWSSKTMFSKNGITLVALVITIIIIVILATVSINLVLGENGIITKASESRRAQDIERIGEKLELEKATVVQEDYKADINRYLDNIVEKGIIEESDIDVIDIKSVNITVERKYVFLIEQEASGNIKIEYLGEVGNLIPKIEVVSTSNTTSSISMTFRLKYAAKYKVTLKQGETVVDEKEENVISNEIIYTKEGLTQEKEYTIKIEAEAAKGAKSEKEIIIGTRLIEGEITVDTIEWNASTHKATVKVSTTAMDYILQYSTDGDNWTNITSGSTTDEYSLGTTVYARLWDGTNESKTYGSLTITETIEPTVTLTEENKTSNSITVRASVSDNESGMPETPTYTFYLKETNKENSTYERKQSGASASYTATELTQDKSYTIKVETTDNAGNIGSTTETIGTKTVPIGTITINDINWNASTHKATVKVSTTETDYTLQYSTDENTWTNITSGSTTDEYSLGTTVYARLWDGKNESKIYASLEITDGNIPKEATITISGSTTQTSMPISLTATVTHSDEESGIAISACRYVLNTSNQTVGTTASSYTGGNFSSNGQAITINPNSVNSWYLHVLTVDNEGNPKETIKGPITVTANVHTHTGSSTTGGGCYNLPVYHTHSSSCNRTCTKTHEYDYIGTYDGTIHAREYVYHSSCGQSREDRGVTYPASTNSWTERHTYIGCGISTSKVQSYSLNCGKNASSIDSYSVEY